MTICFMHEWRDKLGRPRAIFDQSTTNRSFVVMSDRLRQMGIKNYLFPLSLYDHRLKGVLPHTLDDKTDPDGMYRDLVVQECKRNFWYWLREVARVPPAGGDPMPVRLDRGALAMAWCYMNSIKYIGIQPRQTGKSTMALLITVWLLYVAGKNVNVGMLAHQDKLRGQNVSRIKDFRALLPKYMVQNTIKNINNAEKLYYDALNNNYLTAVATDQVIKADQILRGQALAMVHWDEPAFCTNAHLTYPSLIASGSEAMDQCKINNLPCGFILTTTAGDPRMESGKWAMGLVEEALNYSEKLLDLPNQEALVAMVTNCSGNGFVCGTFSHRQLGKTNEWLMERIRGSTGSVDAIQRDWLNRWNAVVGDTVLPKELVRRISASRRDEPLYYEIREGFAIAWYVPDGKRIAYRSRPLVVGLDSSEAVNRDATTMVGIDPNTFEVVFTFKCNEINTTKLIDFIVNFVVDYSHMVLVPERRSTGGVIIDKISTVLFDRGISPFTRIYNDVVQHRGDRKYDNVNINDPNIMDQGKRTALGFKTDGKLRDLLYKSVLRRAAELGADYIRDPNLITEVSALQVKNGRVDHASGGHDDMVVAWMLAAYLMLEGNNLSAYGLTEQYRLRYTSGGASKEETDRQVALYQECAELRRKADATDDAFQKNIYMLQARQVENKIDKSVKIDPQTMEAVRLDNASKPSGRRSSVDETLEKMAAIGL